MLTEAQKKWFEKKAYDFICALGEESIAKCVEEQDYYSEGMDIVLRVVKAEVER